jgi:WD40 repeat protein
MRLWDAVSGKELRSYQSPDRAIKGEAYPTRIQSVAWTKAGDLALSGSSDGVVRLWRLPK